MAALLRRTGLICALPAVCAVAGCAPVPSPRYVPRPAQLGPHEEALIAQAFDAGLFDPTDARRVVARAGADEVRGWRHASSPNEVHTDDLRTLPVDTVLSTLDFAAELRHGTADDVGRGAVAALARAAWAHRLGHRAEAARWLEIARTTAGDSVLDKLRDTLAWHLFDAGTRAFAAGQDTAARRDLEALVARHPERADAFGPGRRILADLVRRAGGVAPATPVGRLEDLAISDFARAGTAAITNHPDVVALVAAGDPGVGPLIDATEHDERLTRTLRYAAERDRQRSVLSVRAVADHAARLIIRERVGPAGLRDYWHRYGRLGYPARVIARLTDPAAARAERRDSAAHLLTLAPTLRARLTGPTPAEGVLQALTLDLDALRREPGPGVVDDIIATEDDYLGVLVRLGDRRIVAALRRRLETTRGPRLRLGLCAVINQLGQPGEIDALARAFAAGTVRPDAPDAVPVDRLVAAFLGARTPAAEAAIAALGRPDHPYNAAARASLLATSPGQLADHPIAGQPVAVRLLGAELRGPSRIAAGNRLAALVFGAPLPAGGSVAELRRFVTDFAGRFRRVTPTERRMLGLSDVVRLGPDLPPLGRPATADDVVARRALFELGGEGQLTGGRLPAVARRRDGGARLLIVQMERLRSGGVWCAFVDRHGLGTVDRALLTLIQPIPGSRR